MTTTTSTLTVIAHEDRITITHRGSVPGADRSQVMWGTDYLLGRAVWIFGGDGDPRRAHKRRGVNPDRHARIRMRHYDNAYWSLDGRDSDADPQSDHQVRMACAAWDAFEAILACQWGCRP